MTPMISSLIFSGTPSHTSAGVPGRHELDDGELNYPNILRKLDELGYEGFFGLEYWPRLPVDESLRKMRALTRT